MDMMTITTTTKLPELTGMMLNGSYLPPMRWITMEMLSLWKLDRPQAIDPQPTWSLIKLRPPQCLIRMAMRRQVARPVKAMLKATMVSNFGIQWRKYQVTKTKDLLASFSLNLLRWSGGICCAINYFNPLRTFPQIWSIYEHASSGVKKWGDVWVCLIELCKGEGGEESGESKFSEPWVRGW